MKIEEKNGNFFITDFDEFEAYRIAQAIEKEGMRLYRKLAEGSPAGFTKEAFAFLLQEEEKHLAFFEKRLAQMRQVREDTWEENDIFSSGNYGIFEPYMRIERLEDLIQNASKAMGLGVLIEERSIQFYTECLKHSSEEATKKELAVIIDEEKKHKAMFKDIMKRVKDAG